MSTKRGLQRMEVGRDVFARFDRKMKKKGNSFSLIAEGRAADLTMHSPFLTQPLIERGIIERNETSRVLLPFFANLSSQEYAYVHNELHRLDLLNANRRAAAVTEYSLYNLPSIRRLLAEKKKDDQTLFYGLRDAALIESLTTAYIANLKLTPQAKAAAGIGLVRRFSRTVPKFNGMVKVFDVDVSDDLAVKQFTECSDFQDICNETWRNDRLFNRRSKFIDDAKNNTQMYQATATSTAFDVDYEDTNESDDAIHLKKARDITFVEKIFLRGVKNLRMDKKRLASLLLDD